MERRSVLGKMGSGSEEGRDERAGCARIWRRRKCSKRENAGIPGFDRRGADFPGQPEISENGKPARATQKSLGERPREEKPKREPPKSGQAEDAPAADERVRKKQAGQTGQRKAGKKRRQRGGPSAAERLRNLGSGLPDASQRRAISFLIREGLAYLKKLCPHLTKADADYSLGDPAWTGELTGVISLWPGVYGKNIHFRPDFESDGIYFRGYVQLESEIYFWQLAFLLLKIYRNEDCRRLFDL